MEYIVYVIYTSFFIVPIVLGVLQFIDRPLSKRDSIILMRVYDHDLRDEYKKKGIRSEKQRMRYIKKYYPEKWEEAVKTQNYFDEQDAIAKDKRRKIEIRNRMFAYEYEEDLYKFFSKYAFIEYGKYTTAGKYVKRDLLRSYLENSRKCSSKEADDIIDNLIEHEILIGRYSPTVTLSGYLRGDICSNWNVVSDRDMNLHKWMINNGYKDPKEIKSE